MNIGENKENLIIQTENKINGWTFVSVALCNTFAILDLNLCKRVFFLLNNLSINKNHLAML